MKATDESKRDSKNTNSKKLIWKILLALFLVGSLTALICVGKSFADRQKAEAQLNSLAEQTNLQPDNTPAPAETVEATVEAAEVPELTLEQKIQQLEETFGATRTDFAIPRKELDFEQLQEDTNADIYAWIYIPDTKIDYPVVQHPTDNAYYLNYNLDGSKGYPGCIYTEDYNSKDFTDVNTVIYGHNMKNGTMFAGLHQYEDSLFFEEHPYVFIYTEDDVKVYEIFAAYESDSEHLLLSYNFDNKTIFQNYLDKVKNQRTMNCNLRQDIAVSSDDRILTLSTCIANKPNNRYLVQGILLNQEPSLTGEAANENQ